MEHRIIKQDKKNKVANLEKIFMDNKGLALFENKGINANEINIVRKKAKKYNIQAIIEKNTLWQIALKNVVPNCELKGEIVAFIGDNAMDAIGFSQELDRNEAKFLIPKAMIDKNGGIFDLKKIQSISKMKNKQGLMGALVMTLKFPAIKLVKILDIIQKTKN